LNKNPNFLISNRGHGSSLLITSVDALGSASDPGQQHQ